MSKQTKYKNIIIEENIDNHIVKDAYNIIEPKENTKILCCCGKIGTKQCIFNACKNCCKTDYCKKHCQQSKDLVLKNCIFCNVKTTLKSDNIYFCNMCYNSNIKLIDNISHMNFMFEISKTDNCFCGSSAPLTCIFNSCRKCCPSKFCSRHNKNIKQLGQYNCSICSKLHNQNLMNSFYIKSNNNITHYCKKCYNDNRILINNLIYNNATDEQIKKFKIKVIETEEEIKQRKEIKEKNEKKQKEFEEFQKELEKYKKGILTDKIIKKLEKDDKFCVGDLMDENIKYKCPICKTIENFEESYRCEDCNRFICMSNCCEIKTELCSVKNCYYCKRGSCNNHSTTTYCKDCFVDCNKNFYNKYKNKIITSEILELEEIDLNDFSNENYELKFNCEICENIVDLDNIHISNCDRCDNFVCKDCTNYKYITCGLPFCTYCITRSCWNGEHYSFCDACIDEMENYDTDSESEEEEVKIKNRCTSPVELANDKTEECNICFLNKKNYACVPCGHLCMCGDCANKVDTKCPICNIEFTNILKIFT